VRRSTVDAACWLAGVSLSDRIKIMGAVQRVDVQVQCVPAPKDQSG
jgi:hypothetical protein